MELFVSFNPQLSIIKLQSSIRLCIVHNRALEAVSMVPMVDDQPMEECTKQEQQRRRRWAATSMMMEVGVDNE